MSFAAYLKGAAGEFLLSCAAATALLYTLLNGFYIDSGLQYSVIPALACIGSLVVLYIVAYNRMTTLIGSIVYALAVAGVLFACAGASGDILVDEEANYLVFGVCCMVTPLVVFLLGRTRGTAAMLFIIGVFIVVFIQFFYERYELIWALLFVLSSLALVIYKNYQRSVETARSVKKVAFLPGFVVALGSVLAAGALACGIWFGIIAPLNPPAADIKLITEEHALETQRVKGIASMFLVPNLDMTSSQTNNEERTTDDLQLVEDGRIVLANGEAEGEPEEQESGGSFVGINLDSLSETFDFQTYDTSDWARLFIVLGIIVLVIVGYFVGRRWWRARRLAKYRSFDPARQIEAIYLFLMGRFERIGFKMPPGQSVLEYAADTAGLRERFDERAGVPFANLTATYTRVVFGDDDVTQEEADGFAAYYKSFWKASRQHLGSLKYFFKSFRL